MNLGRNDVLERLAPKGLGVTPVERRDVASDLLKPLGTVVDICIASDKASSSDLARVNGTDADGLISEPEAVRAVVEVSTWSGASGSLVNTAVPGWLSASGK